MSTQPDKISEETKRILAEEQHDMDDIGTQQRFGFFSIPCNNTLGDGFYSRPKDYNHKIVDRKVITEKRGIFTQPPKTGKNHDAYFQSWDVVDENDQKIWQDGAVKDHNELMSKVQERKTALPRAHLYPPGARHYTDYFDLNPVQRDYPLTKDPPLHHKVVDHKVIIENRGIYTQPLKKGMNNTPNVLFSFKPLEPFVETKEDVKKYMEERKRPQTTKVKEGATFKKEFFPASLKKNECFSNIRETFGYEESYFTKMRNYAENLRKRPKSKYENKLPKSACKQLRPFTPSSLIKLGRDGLFNKGIWNCPSIPENKVIVNQRERVEYERQHQKKAFTYNKLQNHTKFSPSIVTNMVNMKRDYPSVFHF